MQASAVRPVIEPVVQAEGLELDDLAIQRAGSREIVRVTVDGDGPEGRGPSLDDIAACSQAISRALDDSPVTGDRPYVLEVSSRGVGKPLQTPAHWRRNVGRLVTVTGRDGTSLTGRIAAASEGGAELADGDTLRAVSYDDVASAIVQVELNRPSDALDADQPATRSAKESSHGH
ncbi:MAG: ribosome maturation factor RimP [Propionibacteriaceae bacterium]|jgi:ribosome maturation factor RimP|nr:ribosome maturation factor RimP [Propionibacteriaceae bacterium]